MGDIIRISYRELNLVNRLEQLEIIELKRVTIYEQIVNHLDQCHRSKREGNK